MNMEDVQLQELHRFDPTDSAKDHLRLLDMASRCNKIVNELRAEHGHDSVIADKPFRYIQQDRMGYKFFGVEMDIKCDADRIKVERPPVASA